MSEFIQQQHQSCHSKEVTSSLVESYCTPHTASFQDISKPARRTSVVRASALAGFQLPSLAQLLGELENHCPHDFGCLDLNIVFGRYCDQMVSIKRYRQPHLGTRPMKPGGIQKCTMWAYSNSRGSNIHTTLPKQNRNPSNCARLGNWNPAKALALTTDVRLAGLDCTPHTASFQDISKPARRTSVVRASALAGFQLPSLAQLLGELENHCPHDFGCLDLNIVFGRYCDQMVSIKRYRQPHLGTRPMKPGGIQKCTMWAYSNSRGSNIHTTLPKQNRNPTAPGLATGIRPRHWRRLHAALLGELENHCPHDFGCLDLNIVFGRYCDQMVSIKRYRQPHLGTRPMKPGGIQKCTMWAYSNSRGSNIHTTLMHAKVARGSRQPLGHFGPRKWRP